MKRSRIVELIDKIYLIISLSGLFWLGMRHGFTKGVIGSYRWIRNSEDGNVKKYLDYVKEQKVKQEEKVILRIVLMSAIFPALFAQSAIYESVGELKVLLFGFLFVILFISAFLLFMLIVIEEKEMHTMVYAFAYVFTVKKIHLVFLFSFFLFFGWVLFQLNLFAYIFFFPSVLIKLLFFSLQKSLVVESL